MRPLDQPPVGPDLPPQQALRPVHPAEGQGQAPAVDQDAEAFDRALAQFAVSLANVMARVSNVEG